MRSATAGLHAEVIVVDNASADGSMTYLQPRFPEVKFIQSAVNLGFAKACNKALQEATGAYILFLNPDTLLAEDTLMHCLHFFEKNAQAGAVGVRMIDGSGQFLKESKRAFPSPLTSLYKLFGLSQLFPDSKIFSRYYLGHLNEYETHEADVLAGAFMMVPSAVLKTAGSFDEAFFMYGEDIDLSYRIQQAGYRNYYLAGTTIIHFKGESTERANLQYVRQFYAAMHIFVRKHYSGSKAAVFRAALQSAIRFRAGLSAAAKILKDALHCRWVVNNAAGSSHLPVAIVGSNKEYEIVAGALAKNLKTSIHINSLEEAATLAPGQMLILCSGTYDYARFIHFIQQCPKPLRFRFHAAGSGSIVGSDANDTNGEAIGL